MTVKTFSWRGFWNIRFYGGAESSYGGSGRGSQVVK